MTAHNTVPVTAFNLPTFYLPKQQIIPGSIWRQMRSVRADDNMLHGPADRIEP